MKKRGENESKPKTWLRINQHGQEIPSFEKGPISAWFWALFKNAIFELSKKALLSH